MANVSFRHRLQVGFTLIEILMVAVILAVAAVIVFPKFKDLGSETRIETLSGIKTAMRSTISVMRSRAMSDGIKRTQSPPKDRNTFVVESENGLSALDWRNLCPVSKSQSHQTLSMLDLISFRLSGALTINVDERYTRVGYDIRGAGPATADGCYVTYDSFAAPHCTVDIVTTDC